MIHDSTLFDEQGRVCALNRLCVLDTCEEAQFDNITAIVRAVLDVPISAVSLVDVDRQWFKSIQGLDVRETPRETSFCTHTILGRQPMNIPDALKDDRFATSPLVQDDPYIRAYLGAPLVTPDGYNVGSLCAIDRRPRSFSAADEQLLSKFASLVVDELELRNRAQRDFLTGAMNRRAFLDRVEHSLLQAKGAPAGALAIFDIDFFKSVNDRYGHPAGDEVLRGVSKACRDIVLQTGTFGRLGGEEFAIFWPRMNVSTAVAASEEIREAIADLSFRFDKTLHVTASFGVAEVQTSSDVAIAEADAGLYAAKRRGRNRTILALQGAIVQP